MKKLIAIAIAIALGATLFTLAGKAVETTINDSTARAQALATMTK